VSELRQNLATKEWVIIATERAKRPVEFVESNHRPSCADAPSWDERCPFCPGNEEVDLEAMRVPATGDPWRVRIVGNRYPALSAKGELARKYQGIARRITGIGYHEVIVESPFHNTCVALQQPAEVALTFQTFIDRGWMLQSDRRIEYILYFKNHGRTAGASLIHPHAQLMALPIVPNDVRMRADAARLHFDEAGECVFCAMVAQEIEDGRRIVAESEHFVVFAPYASPSPFNLWIIPKKHTASFLYSQPTEVADLGDITHRVLRKLFLGLNNPDYNYAIRTAPLSDLGAPYLHWYITILPRISFAAGFEIGSGIYINPSLPEECAEYLRNIEE
jgi:UDPglucose--hexose-1-phosphate uridylyltransferase